MVKKIIALIVLVYGIFSGYVAYVALTSGVEENMPQGVFSAFAAVVSVIVGLILLGTSKKKKNNSHDDYDEDYEESSSSYGAKPFPKSLMTFLVFIISFGIGIAVALIDKDNFFFKIGEFVCNYAIIFLAIMLVIGIISCTQLVKYGSYDTAIHSAFFLKSGKKLGIGHIFSRFFGSVYAQGPLIFSEKDCDIVKSRTIHCLFMTVYRYVLALVGLVGVVEFCIVGFSNFKSYDDIAYIATFAKPVIGFFILILGAGFDIILYVLRKLFPLAEYQEYKITEYYSDGTTSSSTKIESNILAMLIFGAIIYVYYVGWFWAPTARNIVRLIETKRFSQYCDQYYDVTIYDYYE